MTNVLQPDRERQRGDQRGDHRGLDALVGAAAIGIAARLVGLVVRFLTHAIAPLLFTHYDDFPALARAPKRTRDDNGRRGDPVNLAFVGTAEDIAAAFEAAGWQRAHEPNPHEDEKLVQSILLHRPDATAPVSPLFLLGRKQDVAYEREQGRSAGRRDHVRVWRWDQPYPGDDRPTWLAAATLDTRPGVVLRRLMPTHHIGPDIDEERDAVADDLLRTRRVATIFNVTGLGVRVASRNSSGDRFDTDGELTVMVLARAGEQVAPCIRPDPWRVALKNRVWYAVHRDREAPRRSRGISDPSPSPTSRATTRSD